MRNQYITVLLLLVGLSAHAQSEQYKRAKKTTTPAVQNPGAPVAPTQNNKGKDIKVDIQDLEQQYWTPQDTEFKVVQNRKFSKDNRFALTLQLVPITSDPYTEDNGALSVTFGYYFTEFTGVEINYTKFNVDKSEVVDRFESQFGGISPDYSISDSYIGVNFNWIPIYGKMSIQDKRIIYFDLAISPGIGLFRYEPQTENAAPFADVGTKNAVTFSLDISQHFFFSEHWAFRLDMKTRHYKEERYGYAGASKGEKVSDVSRTVTLWQLGATYYFGQGRNRDEEQSVGPGGLK